MSTIAIDIDDTLFSFNQLARNVVADRAAETGDETLTKLAYAPWVEWRSPVDIINLDQWIDIISECHNDENILNQIPYEGAAHTVWELHTAEQNILYVSNRSQSTHKATEQWLFDNDFPIGIDGTSLVCLDNKSKSETVELCQYIIDDRPKTLIEFVYDYNWTNKWGSQNSVNRRRAFVLYTEYNRSLTDVPGIYLAPSWALLRKYLEKKGVLDYSKVREDQFGPLLPSSQA